MLYDEVKIATRRQVFLLFLTLHLIVDTLKWIKCHTSPFSLFLFITLFLSYSFPLFFSDYKSKIQQLLSSLPKFSWCRLSRRQVHYVKEITKYSATKDRQKVSCSPKNTLFYCIIFWFTQVTICSATNTVNDK